MRFKKCLCFDLRIGVLIFGVLALISSCFLLILHLRLGIPHEDPERAADDAVLLGYEFLNIAIVVCLIYGAYKERRMFLLPYLIIECFVFAIATVMCLIIIFYIPYVIIPLAILWYKWFCVFSLYQLLDPNDPNNPNFVPKSTTTATPDNTVFIKSASPPPPYYNDNKMTRIV